MRDAELYRLIRYYTIGLHKYTSLDFAMLLPTLKAATALICKQYTDVWHCRGASQASYRGFFKVYDLFMKEKMDLEP